MVRASDVEDRIPKLTRAMFKPRHVTEFRDYLRQLLYTLQFMTAQGRDEQDIFTELYPFEF